MAEYEDTIRYRIIVDPAEAQKEAQRAVEKEEGKKKPGPSPSPAKPEAGPPVSPTQQAANAAAEQEKLKARAERMKAPSVASKILSALQTVVPGSNITHVMAAVMGKLPSAASAASGSAGGVAGAVAGAGGAQAAGAATAAGGTSVAGAIASAASAVGIGALMAASVKNIVSGFHRTAGGYGQQLSGAATANPSAIIKGMINVPAGQIQTMLGPLGFVVGGVTDRFTKLIDVADRLANQYARYNVEIASSQMALQQTTVTANIRMANASAGFLSEYNRLKGNVVDIGSKVMAAGERVLSALLTPFLAGGNKILSVADRLLDRLGLGGLGGKGDWHSAISNLIRGAGNMPFGIHMPSAANNAIQKLFDNSQLKLPPPPQMTAPGVMQLNSTKPPLFHLPAIRPDLSQIIAGAASAMPTARSVSATTQPSTNPWLPDEGDEQNYLIEHWKKMNPGADFGGLPPSPRKAPPSAPQSPAPPTTQPAPDAAGTAPAAPPRAVQQLAPQVSLTQNVTLTLLNEWELSAQMLGFQKRLFDMAARAVNEAMLSHNMIAGQILSGPGAL